MKRRLRLAARLAALWTLAVAPGCRRDAAPAAAVESGRGQLLFEVLCAPCHGIDGRGFAAGAPPLEQSPWVAGDDGKVIRIVLHGVRGPVQIGDETYDREMPGFGRILDDGDVATLVSHVRGRFGARSVPTTAAAVARLRTASVHRAEPWTVSDLLSAAETSARDPVSASSPGAPAPR